MGHARKLFSQVFGPHIEVELWETIKSGGKRCVVFVELKPSPKPPAKKWFAPAKAQPQGQGGGVAPVDPAEQESVLRGGHIAAQLPWQAVTGQHHPLSAWIKEIIRPQGPGKGLEG